MLAGRSLREAEARIDRLGLMLVFGWLASLAFSLVLVVVLQVLLFTRSQDPASRRLDLWQK